MRRQDREVPHRADRRGVRTVLVYHPDEADRYAALVPTSRNRVALHVCAAAEDALRVAPEVEVIYGWKVPPAVYEKAARLTWVQATGAGVDWALVPELPPHVVVTRAPGVFGPWMAEYVLGWCAFVTQRIETYRAAQRDHRWMDTVLPGRLRGSTMLVVGLGDIGRTIARAARGVGMRVLGMSRRGRPVPGVERVYRPSALRRALAAADWVVLTVPLTPATRGLLGAPELAAMKPSAWLLNIARGAIVDEAALLEALQRRTIAGAVLDVFSTEPLPPRHPFWDLDNVVITPHISGPSTPEEIAPVFADNLARYLAGRPLRHVVDRRRAY
jgi:glyoxylate/hydroxypyruvate reductase A